MVANFDISEVLRIEMNKAIEKTIRRDPTVRVLNIDEMSVHDLAQYFQKNRSIEQLEYIIEQGGDYELGRWFRVVLGEIYTIATNKQS